VDEQDRQHGQHLRQRRMLLVDDHVVVQDLGQS
jgi:hypothetical protein